MSHVVILVQDALLPPGCAEPDLAGSAASCSGKAARALGNSQALSPRGGLHFRLFAWERLGRCPRVAPRTSLLDRRCSRCSACLAPRTRNHATVGRLLAPAPQRRCRWSPPPPRCKPLGYKAEVATPPVRLLRSGDSRLNPGGCGGRPIGAADCNRPVPAVVRFALLLLSVMREVWPIHCV